MFRARNVSIHSSPHLARPKAARVQSIPGGGRRLGDFHRISRESRPGLAPRRLSSFQGSPSLEAVSIEAPKVRAHAVRARRERCVSRIGVFENQTFAHLAQRQRQSAQTRPSGGSNPPVRTAGAGAPLRRGIDFREHVLSPHQSVTPHAADFE